MAGPERDSDGEGSEEEAAADANRDEDGGRVGADDEAPEEVVTAYIDLGFGF